ncbi:arylamine N-acetyltransferase family protein [Amycolatopsis aidingensis]|uniref:arylamine N-acetyltransferase family protein n=1 Tax=Amycolatopsis aidingensis TaxID=2842453 RepID=UPI001C0E87E6|nr:arylamine N-acetyltransferase [Amycolatopsis aidingensis]
MATTNTAALWGAEKLQLEAYLRRIGLAGELPADPGTLRAVHRAHVTSIPFENLEVLLGGVPALDVGSVQDKLVRQERGGYCYEHTVLFAAALTRLGFLVEGLGARIRVGRPQPQARSHGALLVQAGGVEWLADVGFGGGGLREPMPLRAGDAEQDGWSFRLVREENLWVLRSRNGADWVDLYAFGTEPHYPADYEVYNYFAAAHPDSPFVGRPIALRTTADSRISLRGNELHTATPDGHSERRALEPGELPEVLRAVFGITPPEELLQ